MNLKLLVLTITIISMPTALISKEKPKILDADATLSHLKQTIEWLPRMSADEQEALYESVQWKIEKLKEKLNAVKEELKDISAKDPDKLNRLQEAIVGRITALKDQFKASAKAKREEWKKEVQDALKEIKGNVKDLLATVKEEHPEALVKLNQKVENLVTYLKNMPAEDKAAVRYMLQKKLNDLKEKLAGLRDKNKKAFKELREEIESLVKDKSLGLVLKEKMLKLYQKVHDAIAAQQ